MSFATLFFAVPLGMSEPSYAPSYATEPTYTTRSIVTYDRPVTYYYFPSTYYPPTYYPATYYTTYTSSGYVPANAMATTRWMDTTMPYSSQNMSQKTSTRYSNRKERDGTRIHEEVTTTDNQEFDGVLTKIVEKRTTETRPNKLLTQTVETTNTRIENNGETTIHRIKKVNDKIVEDNTTQQPSP